MTPAAFVSECYRRGITLSVLPSIGPDGLPRLRYRVKGELPQKVRETLLAHKAAIAAALEAESGVWTLPDGRRLFRHSEADWRYVPKGANPSDYISNFPPGFQLRREWLKRKE